jgi:hypothetical protein
MNVLLFLVLLAATTFDYLISLGAAPRFLKFTPEVFSAIVLIYVIFLGVRSRFALIRPAYWFFFGAITIIMLCGAVANGLGTGPVFAGIRTYLRAVPLFLLPAVLLISDAKLRKQLLLLLAICLGQLPVALMQRAATAWRGGVTGDDTSGTLLSSGVLSIFLICATCLLIATLLRKKISTPLFLTLFVLILLPTALNETKITVVLLPLAMLATFLLNSEGKARVKNLVIATGLMVMFAAIFIPIYNYYISKRTFGTPITDFFTQEGRLAGYISKGDSVGIEKAGRLDSILVPINEMARDPVSFTFGLGLGNVSESAFGVQFTGKYFYRYRPFLKSAASRFILEIGIVGFLVSLTFLWLVFRDAIAVSRYGPGPVGDLAAGWIGVVVVMLIATFYTDTLSAPSLLYPFWYFSGVIAAARMRHVQR